MGPRPEIILSQLGQGPGPGQYLSALEDRPFSTGPKFTIRSRPETALSLAQDPGFTYNNPPKTGADVRKSSMKGGRTPPAVKADEVPGPGAYDARDISHRLAPSIHPVLPEKDRSNEQPGYVNTRKFPEIKNRSMHRLLKLGGCWDHDESVPGPDWLPASGVNGPGVTIRSIIPEKPPGTENPGPGTYSIAADAGRNSEPRFTLKGPATRDQWMPRSAQDTPGPGYYDIKSDNGLPKWTLGERTLQRVRAERARTSAAQLRSSKAKQPRLVATV
jgi:hypothetical protein